MPKISECGILLRGYTRKKEEVPDVVKRLYASAMRAYHIGFGKVVILVPADKDCGFTNLAVTIKFRDFATEVILTLSLSGNENSDVLNSGLDFLIKEHDKKYAFIMSNKALGYLTVENVVKMLSSFDDGALVFDDGALVAGLAVRDTKVPNEEDEVFRGVIEGRLSNIFCAWDIGALRAAGGFTSQIGVEEIAPIVNFVQVVGQCIAPVLPVGQESLSISPLRAEHWEKISSTKTKRQLEEARCAGGSFELIKSGILAGYPK